MWKYNTLRIVLCAVSKTNFIIGSKIKISYGSTQYNTISSILWKYNTLRIVLGATQKNYKL